MIKRAVIPECIDAFSSAKDAYVGGAPEFDPADTADEALARLNACTAERNEYMNMLERHRLYMWPIKGAAASAEPGQGLFVTIADVSRLTTSTIDFALVRASGHPSCFRHLSVSGPAGCPAKDLVRVLAKLHAGAEERLLPGERPTVEDTPTEREADDAANVLPQSYIMRPHFFTKVLKDPAAVAALPPDALGMAPPPQADVVALPAVAIVGTPPQTGVSAISRLRDVVAAGEASFGRALTSMANTRLPDTGGGWHYRPMCI